MKKFSLVVATLLLSATPVCASTIQSSTFFAGPINLTFDDPGETVLADHTAVTNQFQAQGIDFSGIFYNPVGPNPGTPNNSGNGVGDFYANGPVFPTHFIDFVNPATGLPMLVDRADFSLASQPATATITALLGGVPVETFSPHTDLSQTNNIFGFSGILFDSISITITPDPTAAVQDHADLIDNIQFSAVPEPASLAALAGLGGMGLLGLTLRRRRRS